MRSFLDNINFILLTYLLKYSFHIITGYTAKFTLHCRFYHLRYRVVRCMGLCKLYCFLLYVRVQSRWGFKPKEYYHSAGLNSILLCTKIVGNIKICINICTP